VVAGEIGSLVNQTNDATAKISARVGGVQEEVRTMKEKIGIIDKSVTEQKEMTSSVISSLEDMKNIASEAKKRMEEQLSHMDCIISDSAKISDSISTLSGISEETTAGASTTLELVNDSVDRMGELKGEVKAILDVLK
jgi:methyl-accepting chemotaxis protein